MTTVLEPPTVPGTILHVAEKMHLAEKDKCLCAQLSHYKLAVDKADTSY